jgi:hypothetical protein
VAVVSRHGGCIAHAHSVVMLIVVVAMVHPVVVLVVRGHLRLRSAWQHGACGGEGTARGMRGGACASARDRGS